MTTNKNFPPFYEHPLAELYALSTLDFVMELAKAVSKDFYQRSQYYKKLPEEIAEKIIDFRSYLGSHPDWPNVSQRSSVYKILSEGNQLCAASVSFRLAALSLSERSEDSYYLQAFYDAVKVFQAYIRKNSGIVLATGIKHIRTLFNTAIEILTNENVVKIYGGSASPKRGWPLGGILDVEGACVLENINKTIFPLKKGKINQNFIFAKQRIAHYGALPTPVYRSGRPRNFLFLFVLSMPKACLWHNLKILIR